MNINKHNFNIKYIKKKAIQTTMNTRKKVKQEVIIKCIIIVDDNGNIPMDLHQSCICMFSNDTFFEKNFPWLCWE